jgi:hypothetical protein
MTQSIESIPGDLKISRDKITLGVESNAGLHDERERLGHKSTNVND